MKRLLLILALLWLAAPAHAAQNWAHVGSQTACTSAATSTCTAYNITGDTLVAFVVHSTTSTITAADSGGKCTWAQAGSYTDNSGSGNRQSAWFGYNCATGSTNVTFASSSGTAQALMNEYSGLLKTGTPLDRVNSATQLCGTACAWTVSLALATQSNDDLLWVCTNDDNATPDVAAGWTDRGTATITGLPARCGDTNGATQTTYTAAGTTTATGNRTSFIAAFTPAPTYSTDLSSFLFRNDDGTETTATGYAAEHTNVTAALNTVLRLRAQINTVLDTPTSQKQLEWKRSTDAAYRKVDVAPSPVVYTICASGCTSTTNFVAPVDVFSAVVECWGGGGAGARAAANSTPGGGGKGGSYAKVNAMPLTPGTTYSPTIGGGGVSATPTNGGATDFIGDATTHCTAAGGVTPAISSLTGASTVNGTSVGDVINAGGNGATGSGTNAGGGGEAGGSSTVGAAGSGASGGTGNNADGGDGGAGRTASNGVGSPGLAPGGAGGGALRVSSTSNNGGAGAAGRVKITYTATPAVLLSVSANIAAAAATATTAQLTSPGGSFTAGHISDDTNPLPTTDIGSGGYSEDEWSVKAVSPAVNGYIIYFRVTLAGTALTSYTYTPTWTIGTPGAAAAVRCTMALLGAGPC